MQKVIVVDLSNVCDDDIINCDNDEALKKRKKGRTEFMARKIKQVSSHKYSPFPWKRFSALNYENHFSCRMDNKRTFPTDKKRMWKEVLCAFYQIWSCDDDGKQVR